jgi:hypothetical protein
MTTGHQDKPIMIAERPVSDGDNKAVLEAFVQAFIDGDLERMSSHLADDVVLHEAAVLPYGGDHVGGRPFSARCRPPAPSSRPRH